MTAPTTLKSSRKLFSILELVIETGDVGVTEMARHFEMPKGTVHMHLQTLVEVGVLVKRGDRYQPSLQLYKWGEQVRADLDVYRAGRNEITNLADQIGELVNLGVPENGKVRIVHFRDGSGNGQEGSLAPAESTEFAATPPNVSNLDANFQHTLGEELYMHSSAMGKAILAECSVDEAAAIIERHGLPRFTDQTIGNQEALLDELEQVRDAGVAVDREEQRPGAYCVGAAISPDNTPLGAVSVTLPVGELTHGYQEEVVSHVTDLANIIEIKLTYADPDSV